ncbi:MAG TPA: hypothetical protein VFV08_00920 [Puia sp.]|nr:hypothetical protein [Puia sp.]
MITKVKLAIYTRYQGNLSAFSQAPVQDQKLIDEDDFHRIDDLIHRIARERKLLSSPEEKEYTRRLLDEYCDNGATIEELRRLTYLA